MNDPSCELEAIRNTLAAYNIAGDRLQLKTLASTFTEAGVLETPIARMEGRAAILQGLGGGRSPADPKGRRPTLVRHHLTTCLLDLKSSDTADGRSYFIVYTDIGPDHIGAYLDQFWKIAGKWLIAERRVYIDWMNDQTFFTDLLVAHRERLAARGEKQGFELDAKLGFNRTPKQTLG
jgi:hypothetical protein